MVRFARALGLKEHEEEFFTNLVAFNQAEREDEKNEAFERITASRRFRQARRLDKHYFDYLSHWYHPAIREMAGRPDFREDPEWIASRLLPPISPAQAKKSLALLLELGLLVRNPEGRLERGESSLTTGHEVRSLAIGNFHRQMLQRAADSIELVERELRDISALTVCISRQTVTQLKTRIQSFRETLLDLCDRDQNPEMVYQLNFQLFPLTSREGEKK